MDWGNWSECTNGIRSREQYVVSEESMGGLPCPLLKKEDESKMKAKLPLNNFF